MTSIEKDLGEVIGHIQTDIFCESCGYNLHTQVVLRDPRLGILICRCPECGRFTPAGKSTAREVWLHRFGIALIVAWVLFLLLIFALCTLFLGMIAYGFVMNAVTFQQVTPTTNISGTGPVYANWHYVIRTAATAEEAAQFQHQQIALASVAGGLALLTGGLFSVLLWHCKSWRRIFAFAPPLIGLGFALLSWNSESMTLPIRPWGQHRMLAVGLGECIAVAIGLYAGRPIARGVFCILVPPRLLQHLAFFWTTDGKRLKLHADAPLPPSPSGRGLG